MHPLLARQIQDCFEGTVPEDPAVARFIDRVRQTYSRHDAERSRRQEAAEEAVIAKLRDAIDALQIGHFEDDFGTNDIDALVGVLHEQVAMRNHVEALLREREEGLRLILESAKGYAIYRLDREGHITSWNAGAERITGYASDEVIGRHYAFFYPEDESAREYANTLLTEASQKGKAEAEGWRLRKPQPDEDADDARFWADVTLTALRDENRELLGFVMITRDTTDAKRSAEALRAAKEAAEAANIAKGEFLANMSHEIRTPMNAVIGMTSLLLDTNLDEEQLDFVETVRNSGDALLSIINDILDFSKIEAGMLSLDLHPFKLYDCVEDTLDLFAAKAAEKGIMLAYHIEADVPEVVESDMTRLRQVLVNLVSNAVKFTSEGEVTVTVRAEEAGEKTRLVFAVADTGIGIPPDRMDRLFKSFSQVDSSNTRKYGGTGLGLVISKRLVEIMGGAIEVASKEGMGTTFTFSIEVGVEANARGLEGKPEWKGHRVLIVEPNETLATILTQQAERWGLRPLVVTSSDVALRALQAGTGFHLVLYDSVLNEANPTAFADALHARTSENPIPFIFLGQRGNAKIRDYAKERSHVRFVSKPVRRRQLHQVLSHLLSEAGPSLAAVPSSPTSTAVLLDQTLGEQMPMRILLAEDNLVNQKVAVRLLERLGYRIDVVANGLEVLLAVERRTYDVLLMDVQMPEMDGLEAAEQVRATIPVDRQPYIIALTANATHEDRRRCLDAGMNDHITKPLRAVALVYGLRQAKRYHDKHTAVEK